MSKGSFAGFRRGAELVEGLEGHADAVVLAIDGVVEERAVAEPSGKDAVDERLLEHQALGRGELGDGGRGPVVIENQIVRALTGGAGVHQALASLASITGKMLGKDKQTAAELVLGTVTATQ